MPIKPKINVKIALRYQIWLFAVVAIAVISGVAFFIIDKWFDIEGEFGIEKHPSRFAILKIHGASAFLMMMTYGFFLGGHVRSAWQLSVKPILGIISAILPLLLMVTGYMLYYIATDLLRIVVSYTHLGIGILLPTILVGHLLNPPNKKKRKKKKGGVDEKDSMEFA